MKDRSVVFIDDVRKRIETIDEIFTNFELLPVAAVLYVTASLLVSPLQPLGGFQAGFSVGLAAVPRNYGNFVLLSGKVL